MKKHFLLLGLSMVANAIYAQPPIIGQVSQPNGQPVDYFSVRFLADTMSVATGSFVGGKFSANVPQNVNAIEVSAWNYQPYRSKIALSADTIRCILTPVQHIIDEVNIVANKQTLTIDGDTYTLAVAGTNLSAAANVNDILSKVPLVMIDENNQASMFGKDNLVVYINNRRIKNSKELESLNPQRIKDVKLIASPSAKYDADADAVVKITTTDNNGTDFTLRDIATQGRKFSNTINPSANLKLGATNIYADYAYTAKKSKSYESNEVMNSIENQDYKDNSVTEGKLTDHSYTIVGERTFSNANKLSLQLVGWNGKEKPKVEAIQNYSRGDSTSVISTMKDITGKENHYDISASYDFTITEKNDFSVYANYTTHDAETDMNILENQSINTYNFNANYKAFDGQIDYQTSMENGLDLSAGVKVSYVQNESESSFNSENTMLKNSFTYGYDFTERLLGAYLDISKKFGNLNANAGLRVEHTYFEGNNNNIRVIDTTYFTFAPNIKMTYSTANKHKLTLGCRSSISRPSFSNLSPNIRYDNEFFYRRGNPSLLPTITTNVALMWDYASKFWANIAYRHKRNATIFEYYESPINSDVIEVLLSNHKRAHFLLFSAGYNLRRGKFSSTNSVSITKPFATIKLADGEYKIRRAAYYFKTTNSYSISKNLSVNADFLYSDLGETVLEHKAPMYNLSMGATAFMLDKKLAISLFINDILDTYQFTDHRKFSLYDIEHTYNPDNTFARLTARYTFRSGKTQRVRVNDNNAQMVGRM
ncbi:MAG: outer membrane beta-barrel family protein [Marinilabiliaceae bacterium]|nr:outer membrane beta-barrel family protein [Marinilabiliaceae bacterium]